MHKGIGSAVGITIHNLVRVVEWHVSAQPCSRALCGVPADTPLLSICLRNFFACPPVIPLLSILRAWQGTFFGGLFVGFYFNWKLTLVILSFLPLMMFAGSLVQVFGSCFLRSPVPQIPRTHSRTPTVCFPHAPPCVVLHCATN